MSSRRSYLRPEGASPRIIAHRGLSSRAPENTSASVRAAMATGAPMVEVDVHLTADDEVVAIHDRTLQRTTTGNGAVRSYALSELRQYDAGSWFDPAFAEERIPTLREILSLSGPELEMNVEIKSYRSHRIKPDHLAARVVSDVRDAKALDRVLFTSFDSKVLEAVLCQDGEISVGFLIGWMRSLIRHPLQTARSLGADVFICARQAFRRSYLEEAHTAGIAVFVYTVNDVPEAQRLSAAGVDGIITDAADKLMAIF